MFLRQYRAVMKEIDSGAEIRGALYNEGGHCIMGNLIHAIDKSIEIWGMETPDDVDMEVAIANRFGLSSEHQNDMMEINDTHGNTSARRSSLRAYMKKHFPEAHAKYLASKAKVKKATVKVDTAATKLINALVAAKPAKRRCTCGCGQMTHIPAREKVAV